MDKGFNAKVSDFGTARKFPGEEEKSLTDLGTRDFKAPEVESGIYGPEIDVWSFGKIIETLARFLKKEIASDMTNLKVKCLGKQPATRPSFDEISYLLKSFQKKLTGTMK